MLFTSILLGLLGASIASPVQNVADGKHSKDTKYLISFGDSYSQSGFNISLTLPSSANPIGNPPFPGWTTSGGTNWIGYLVSTFNTSLTLSYNFADGGATVDASLVLPFRPTVHSLIDQVSIFRDTIATHPKTTPWKSSNTLFAIWLGVNDVGNSNGNATTAPLWDQIIDAYFAQADLLYASGGRHFAFLSVPPIERTPSVLQQSEEVQAHEKAVILSFNGKLENAAKAWSHKKRGVAVKVVDTQKPFGKALDHPTRYGANSSGATCWDEDGVTCLWWNDYHPGTAIHKLVAQELAEDFAGSFF